MATEMQNVMKLATSGVLDGRKLKDMFANVNAQFTAPALNTSGINLKDQSAPVFQADVARFIDTLVKVSKSPNPGSRGVEGIAASSANPASKFALTGNGMNYAQIFNKAIMGGLITYQIVNNYMTAGIAESVDNSYSCCR
jgi:hypothetical protein